MGKVDELGSLLGEHLDQERVVRAVALAPELLATMVCMTGPAERRAGTGVALAPLMTHSPPASRDEIAMLLGEVDESYVDRVLDIGASVDEISEAIADLEGRLAEPQHLPSTARVAEVREVLCELIDAAGGSRTFPFTTVPMGHPI